MLDFDIWTIVFSVINILVLFFFLKKFLFGRVGAMLEKRAQMVQADMDQAKQKAAEAEKLRSDYDIVGSYPNIAENKIGRAHV